MPLLTLHTTGDGQVPINQALVLRDRAEVAGRSDRLVQRVIEDPGHCGFTTGEQEAAFQALADWVEHGDKPEGTDLGDDLTHLDPSFEDHSRTATPPPGSRVTLRGRGAVTELSGEVYDDDSAHRHDTGSRVEAYVGSTRCGVASVRENGFYILAVAGSDTIAGCTTSGRLRFEVDGHHATETATNTPDQASHLDLTAPL